MSIKRKSLVTLDPYELRRKGLDKPLSGEEFGRALFHLNQRRGFRSNRKTDAKDNEKLGHEKKRSKNCMSCLIKLAVERLASG